MIARSMSPAPNNSVNSRFDYTYTLLNQVATLGTIDGTWTYTYDAAGQLVNALATYSEELRDLSRADKKRISH